MTKIFSLFLLVFFIAFSPAQVIIGDNVGTAANKASVLLEFSNKANKGLLLPYLTALPTTPAQGSIILDATAPTAARAKYYDGTGWIDLSGQDADITAALATQPPASAEASSAKTVIGSSASAADGILVLESTTKVMVLPQVADISQIINPAPGMMVYVNSPNQKLLAVFNGANWSFWKK